MSGQNMAWKMAKKCVKSRGLTDHLDHYRFIGKVADWSVLSKKSKYINSMLNHYLPYDSVSKFYIGFWPLCWITLPPRNYSDPGWSNLELDPDPDPETRGSPKILPPSPRNPDSEKKLSPNTPKIQKFWNHGTERLETPTPTPRPCPGIRYPLSSTPERRPRKHALKKVGLGGVGSTLV